MADLIQQPSVEQPRWRIPLTSVTRVDDGVVIELEVPGLVREEIEVEVQEQELTVQGTCADIEDQDVALIHERTHPSYRRRFALSSDLDSDKLEARLTDGVLSISIPRAEAARPKQIEIH